MARGRRWSFDREQALEQAMLLFWERGYSSTSFKTLQSAMGIPHPQSLIGAFGSKLELFEATLNAYWERRLGPVLAWLDADESVEAFEACSRELLGSTRSRLRRGAA